MLETNLCGARLRSPVMLGSGTLGERKEALVRALQYGAGAVVSRTLRVDNTKREVFKPGYYWEDGYMLNADNNNTNPWDYWIAATPEVEKTGPLVVSISARHPEDCYTIVSALEAAHPPSFYEVNFSCSHSAKLYGRISHDDAKDALRAVKERSKKPVFLKLSLDNMDPGELEKLDDLVDAYVLSNTIGPGLKIDVRTRRPALASVVGGLSGAAIKPLVLAGIIDLKRYTEKPIIGVGGIETAEDILEYLIVGCDAVQVYTAAHRRGLHVFEELNSELSSLLGDMKETVEGIKGTLITGG